MLIRVNLKFLYIFVCHTRLKYLGSTLEVLTCWKAPLCCFQDELTKLRLFSGETIMAINLPPPINLSTYLPLQWWRIRLHFFQETWGKHRKPLRPTERRRKRSQATNNDADPWIATRANHLSISWPTTKHFRWRICFLMSQKRCFV